MAKRDKTEDLVKELIHEEDWKRMNATAELLKRGPDAVRHLLAALTDENPRLRAGVALMLWRIEAMDDPDLRVIASRSLKHIGELRERIDGILNGLRDLEDTVALEEARVGVVMNLMALGRPAVSDLREALEDGHWMVREVAAQALGLIGDLRAVEPLLRKAKADRDMGVRESCIKALGEFGDARAVEVLVEAVNVPTTRLAASEGLSKIKDVSVLLPHIELIKRMKSDRDGLVSYHGGLILDKLDKLMSE